MKVEVKGKHLTSIPVYLVNQRISFKYDAENNRLVIELCQLDLAMGFLQLWGFDVDDFKFKMIKR